MQKILLFDIDGTIFDPKLFLNLLFDAISKQSEIGSNDEFFEIFRRVRSEANYFIPEKFIDALIAKYPTIDRKKLEEIFWNIDLFRKSVYKDTLVLNTLAQNATLGIFSKGEDKFQKFKLKAFNGLFNEKNVYIYPNKLEHINEVVERYANCEIIFIDNQNNVLETVKQTKPECKVILIDRAGDKEDNKSIIKIRNLEEIENSL